MNRMFSCMAVVFLPILLTVYIICRRQLSSPVDITCLMPCRRHRHLSFVFPDDVAVVLPIII
jgi:hypothetical protein